MIVLVLGVLLWTGAHLFKRLAPGRRAALGERGRGIVAILVILSVVLMVIGYRNAGGPVWWGRSAAMTGINNLLMILAIYLFAASGAKTWITTKIRHPQLTAIKTWAVAHLLVNGDLASFVLFGGLLAWAVVEVIVINRQSGPWVPPAPAPARKEVTAIVATVVVYAVVSVVHAWLGAWPFG